MTESVTAAPEATYDDRNLTASSSDSNSDQNDPDVRNLIAAWPMLPEAVRAGIVAMVEASKR